MVTVISLFNHKGGVSKTTTAFNLGWMLARKGKRVLLVDGDPQCNLTGMVLGLENLESTDSILGNRNGIPLNIKEGLSPAFESKPELLKAVECVSIPRNENLFLLPGHIGLAEYEVTLGIAQELSGSVVTLKNLPGSLRYLIDITSKNISIDIAIVDMSPSLGALNQNFLMTSDYFIVPMHPDYFSNMAISSLANTLPKWKKWARSAANNPNLKEATYPFPLKKSAFLGYVVQKYRPRNGAPTRAFQTWIEQLEDNVKSVLMPSMKDAELLLNESTYSKSKIDPTIPLLQMPDFNSLIAISQTHQVPIFELTATEIDQVGQILENTQKSQELFKKLFDEAADKILSIINEDSH